MPFGKASKKTKLPAEAVITVADAETVKQNKLKTNSKQKSHPPTGKLEDTFYLKKKNVYLRDTKIR